MKMYAFGWKKYNDVYTVQVHDIKNGDKGELNKVFKDWSESANGWNLKSGDSLIIFNKSFSGQKEWLEWAKKCPIKLTEIRVKSGKEEHIQLSCKDKKKRVKQ